MTPDSCCPKCHAQRQVYATGWASLYKCRACGHRGLKHVFWPHLLNQRPSLHWAEAGDHAKVDGRVLPDPTD